MKVVKVSKNKFEIKNIKNTLEIMQAEVGGYIESVRITSNIRLIVDESGILMKKPIALDINGNFIYGDCFFCEISGNKFKGLSAKSLDYVVKNMSIWLKK